MENGCHNDCLTFRYTFLFEDGSRRNFSIHLDSSSLNYIPNKKIPNPPFWTKLSYFQCVNCPLDNGYRYCPVAINFLELFDHFNLFYSYNTEFFWLVLFLYYLLSLALLKKEFSYRQVFDYFTKSHRLYLVMIAIISFGLIFVRLGANHLIPWDEAIYAKIAKNMVIKDEYLNLYWKKNILWFEKPPLVMWLMTVL